MNELTISDLKIWKSRFLNLAWTHICKTFEMFEGDLPKKAQELVTEWLSLHSDELQEMWDKQI